MHMNANSNNSNNNNNFGSASQNTMIARTLKKQDLKYKYIIIINNSVTFQNQNITKSFPDKKIFKIISIT